MNPNNAFKHKDRKKNILVFREDRSMRMRCLSCGRTEDRRIPAGTEFVATDIECFYCGITKWHWWITK